MRKLDLPKYRIYSFDGIDLDTLYNEHLKVVKNQLIEFDGVKFNSQVKDCLRIWPQDNDSEGFFVAKIKKL